MARKWANNTMINHKKFLFIVETMSVISTIHYWVWSRSSSVVDTAKEQLNSSIFIEVVVIISFNEFHKITK